MIVSSHSCWVSSSGFDVKRRSYPPYWAPQISWEKGPGNIDQLRKIFLFNVRCDKLQLWGNFEHGRIPPTRPQRSCWRRPCPRCRSVKATKNMRTVHPAYQWSIITINAMVMTCKSNWMLDTSWPVLTDWAMMCFSKSLTIDRQHPHKHPQFHCRQPHQHHCHHNRHLPAIRSLQLVVFTTILTVFKVMIMTFKFLGNS